MAKKLNPQEQQRVEQRKAFVKARPDLDPAVARQRFFVQTRVQELTKSGIDVTDQLRAGLREQFTSGNVKRQGFYTPKDIANSRNNNNNNNNNNNTVDSPPTRIPGGVAAAAAKAKGMVNTSTPITYGPRTTTSSTTPASSGTSTTTSSATPKKSPFNNPVTRFIGKTILDTGDSINATFVNPTVNLVGQKVFNKNPNLREAGPVESAINTADAIATIYSAGGSKVIGTAVKSAAKPFINKFASTAVEKGLFRTAYALEGIAARSGFRQAEKTALTKVESAALRSQASKDAAQSTFDRAPGANRSTPRIPKAEPEFIPGGLDNSVPFKNKSGAKPPKTKPSTVTEVKGEKAVPKPTSKKTKASKVESTDPVVGKTDKDLAAYSDTGPTGPIDMSSTRIPKAKPTTSSITVEDLTNPGSPTKRVEWTRDGTKEVSKQTVQEVKNVFANVEGVTVSPAPIKPQRTLTEKNKAVVDGVKTEVAKGKSRKLNTRKAELETLKAEPPATNLSRPVTGSTKAPVETHARAGLEYPTTTKFTTQQGYDNWLATGGKEKLKQLAGADPGGLVKFQQQNVKFIRSKEASKKAAKDLANKAEVDAAKKAIAHADAVKAGTPEASPAVQEAAKLKAAEVPTAPKAKTEPAKKTPAKKTPAKKKSSSGGKTPKALNNLLMGRGGL